MTPAEYNIQNQYRNDTFDGVEFTILNEVTEIGIDLTGCTIEIQFKGGYNKSELVKSITNQNKGVENTDLVNGVFTILPFIVDWKPDMYFYDIQIKFPDGVIKTFVRGTVTIIDDISR